jgi:hypothetical protein
MLAAMTCADPVMTFREFNSRFYASQNEQAIGDYAEYRIVRGLINCTHLPPLPEPTSCKGPYGGNVSVSMMGRALTFEPMWLNGAWTCVLTSRP